MKVEITVVSLHPNILQTDCSTYIFIQNIVSVPAPGPEIISAPPAPAPQHSIKSNYRVRTPILLFLYLDLDGFL